VPPVTSIVIDKIGVENDYHLKMIIKRYVDNLKIYYFAGRHYGKLEIISVLDVSVKTISGTTFILDISYEYSQEQSPSTVLGKARMKIEKTAESYKVISSDKKF
jgi:competence transcription factor ComK